MANKTTHFLSHPLKGAALTGLLCICLLSGCGKEKEISLYVPEETYGQMELGDYKNLTGTKKIYTADDTEIDDQIQTLLTEKTQIQPVDRAIQDGDDVSLALTGTSDGETVLDYSDTSEDGTFDTIIGYNELGSSFDAALIGKNTGDTFPLSIVIDDDSEYEELIGKQVDFDITILSVSEELVPTLDKQMIQDLGYESEEDMRSKIREEIEQDYNLSFEQDCSYALLQEVTDRSSFTSYTDELHATCEESVSQGYMGYMDMLGVSTLQEVFDAFEITNDDLQQEIESTIYQMMTVNAIAKAENMTVSQKEYDQLLEDLAAQYEYESSKALIDDCGEDSLRYYICEEKVLQFLVDHASITEVNTNYEQEQELDSFEEYDDSELLLDDSNEAEPSNENEDSLTSSDEENTSVSDEADSDEDILDSAESDDSDELEDADTFESSENDTAEFDTSDISDTSEESAEEDTTEESATTSQESN